MTTLSTWLGSGLLLAGLLAAPLGLQAQGKSQKMTVDDIALKNYSLSMSNMRKLRDAMVEMQAYAKAHPDEADKWDTGDDDSKTLNRRSPRSARFRRRGRCWPRWGSPRAITS